MAQGDLAEAQEAYGEGLEIAKRLAESDPSNSQWQRDLSVSYDRLGDVAVAQGDLAEAQEAYEEGLEVAKRLAESDPNISQWQRDLWVSYWRLADVAERDNRSKEAQQYWGRAYRVLSMIKSQGLHISPEDEQYLESLRQRVHTNKD